MGRPNTIFAWAACAALGAAIFDNPAWAQSISIEHKPVGCLVADRFPVLEAHFQPADAVARARVVFRAVGNPIWYSVAMKRGAAAFQGTLPRPLKSTEKIEYYIDVLDRSLAAGRTPDYAPDVVGKAAECAPNIVRAAVLTSAKVAVGPLTPGATAVPAGFSGVGLVGGLSTGAIVGIVGAGAAVAGGVAVAAGGGGSSSTTPATVAAIPPTTIAAAPPTTTVLPAPTPTPPPPPATTLPAAPNVAGRWAGTIGIVSSCPFGGSLSLDLAQSGNALSGVVSFTVTSSSGTGTECETVGRVYAGPVTSGGIAGSAVTFSSLLNPGEHTVVFSGTQAGSTMGGTLTADGPQTPGTWNVGRP